MNGGGPCFVNHPPSGGKVRLPVPDPDALAHSRLLCGQIRDRIASAGGAIAFSEYMELALYTPGLGYYMAGQERLGAGGDFVTAPEMGSVLGQVLARFLRRYVGLSDGILEIGPGSGRLAQQIRGGLPGVSYGFLERSPDFQARQRTLLPDVPHRQSWPRDWEGVFLAHELLDAIPFQTFLRDAGGDWWERGVRGAPEGFGWAQLPLDPALAAVLEPYSASWQLPYCGEIRPMATAWLASAAASLKRGALVLIDYGYAGQEYYHPQRSMGTLRAYYRHHALDGPFLWPGLCDLTAHVDFGALMQAAPDFGLRPALFVPMAKFLVENGLAEVYAEQSAGCDPSALMALNNEVKQLTLPQEMGESFKILVLEKGDVR